MAALEVFNCSSRSSLHRLPAPSVDFSKRAAFSDLRLRSLQSGCGSSFSLGITHLREESGIARRQQQSFSLGGRKAVESRVVLAKAQGGGGESGLSEKFTEPASKEKSDDAASKRSAEIRTTITEFLEKKAGYSWILGPTAVTAAIVIPSTSGNLVSLLQNNFLLGLAAIFGQDLLFVFAADLFLVLSDKLGHHQKVSGGPPPWIGPWEYTGYPKGYPKLLNYITYGSVGVSALAVGLSLFTGKLPGAVAAFGPFLGLIFAQVAYERLLANDRSPVYPLVPIVYTVYRFRQLTRALVLLPAIADGSGILSRCVHISSILWALYLGMHLAQLPWLYSTWNSNRAT